MIDLVCILLIAAAISAALGILAAVRCFKYTRKPEVMFFIERDPRWGYRR